MYIKTATYDDEYVENKEKERMFMEPSSNATTEMKI